MEELMKIKEQEIARLSQMKDILQQKLADENARIKVVQKELEIAKAQSNAIPPQALSDMSQIHEEVTRMAERLTRLETRVLKQGIATGKSGEGTATSSLEEKVDLILNNFNQFLAKVRVASKMAKAQAPETQPTSQTQAMGASSTRSLKPSDILQKSSEEDIEIPTSEVEEKKEEPPVAAVSTAKPSEIMKRRQKEEETEKLAKEAEAAEKEEKPRKPSMVAKGKLEPEIPAPAEKQAESEGEKGEPDKKNKEAEVPGAGILTVPYPADGSIVCPKCNKQNYQEMQDPTNVVAYAPVKKFGRKFYCKSCRCNWRYKN
ncbi:MAG: hypothetical protein RBG13Loki_2275 [Promethearchaeota archaeon CR_4]|nr:MAG: hypothetical protein RBG13Loki_2275 [Candidatus Lokiarchaeota archaeon CR_4]